MRVSWEKLPSKYEKLFRDLQDLFDPSRNMAKYRNVLSNQNMQPPIIPLFPVVKKDLTFLHEGRMHTHTCTQSNTCTHTHAPVLTLTKQKQGSDVLGFPCFITSSQLRSWVLFPD